MKHIGIRDLKTHASDLVRRVFEEHATYTITRRGQPVGVLTPVGCQPPPRSDAAWDRLKELWDRADKSSRPRKSALRELATTRR
jgi:prevent-host-death family protein